MVRGQADGERSGKWEEARQMARGKANGKRQGKWQEARWKEARQMERDKAGKDLSRGSQGSQCDASIYAAEQVRSAYATHATPFHPAVRAQILIRCAAQ